MIVHSGCDNSINFKKYLNFKGYSMVIGLRGNVVKLSASWQDKPLAEGSRSQQSRFDSAQRTA